MKKRLLIMVFFVVSLFAENSMLNSQSLPTDFPKLNIKKYEGFTAEKGYLLMSTRGAAKDTNYKNYIIILDDSLNVKKYKKTPNFGLDFKIQPNGLLSYSCNFPNNASRSVHYLMDNNLNYIDSFRIRNNVVVSPHDFLFLPNGHKVLISHNPEYIDLSSNTYQGDPNALITNSYLHEYDQDGNLVFQWNSRDHVDIGETFFDVKSSTFSFSHINSVDMDRDGNFIVSMRGISQIAKINRSTGDFVWRIGGKKNQFKFINENSNNAIAYFSMQHDARRHNNGNISLFDNGIQHDPNYSRAVEYKIDEVNKTVELVWDYIHNPSIYGFAMGSVKYLNNGGKVVGWGTGGEAGGYTITEIDANNNQVYDIGLPEGVSSYRGHKYDNLTCDTIFNSVVEVAKGFEYKLKNKKNEVSAFSIKVNDYVGTNYNIVELNENECSDIKVNFENDVPFVSPGSYNLKLKGINSIDANIIYNLDNEKYFFNKNDMKVYFLAKNDSIYRKVITTIDPQENTLSFNVKGEGKFIFALDYVAVAAKIPSLKSPVNNQNILLSNKNWELRWNSDGVVDNYLVQISNDENFTNIVKEFTQNLSFSKQTLPAGKYFWKAKAINKAGTSEWSEVNNFTLSNQIISSFVYPSGNEKFNTDSTLILNWHNNANDTVKVTLMNIDTSIKSIVLTNKSFLPMNKFKWKIPKSAVSSSNYYFKIDRYVAGVLDEKQNTIVSEKFEIQSSSDVSSDESTIETINSWYDYANQTLNIQKNADIKISTIEIFDITGQLIGKIDKNEITSYSDFDQVKIENKFLANGVYFLQIKSNNLIFASKLLIQGK